MLEASLGKDRHLHSGHRGDPPRNDLALELIESADIVPCQVDEWNCLGYGYHIRAGVGAEAPETVVMGRSISARVGTTQSSAVGERMLDLTDAPAFLVEHLIMNHAANGELRIL